MRNYADEILFLETVRTRQCMPRTAHFTCSDSRSQPEKLKRAVRPNLKCQWILVDEELELLWSDDREEPLRCAA